MSCKKPNCDCIEKAIAANGGDDVKSYPCLHPDFDVNNLLKSFGEPISPFPPKVYFIESAQGFVEWSIITFDGATSTSSLKKLCEEIEEVIEQLDAEPFNKPKIAEEFADCLMCIFDSAIRSGIRPDILAAAFDLKAKENMQRKWRKNPDNTYSHIKESK